MLVEIYDNIIYDTVQYVRRKSDSRTPRVLNLGISAMPNAQVYVRGKYVLVGALKKVFSTFVRDVCTCYSCFAAAECQSTYVLSTVRTIYVRQSASGLPITTGIPVPVPVPTVP